MFWRSIFNISIICFFFHFITLNDLWNFRQVKERVEVNEVVKTHYDVVIGVLSARGNTELRQALRDTWVGYLKVLQVYHKVKMDEGPTSECQVLVKFIVGDKVCHYPVHKRLDEYGCEVSPVQFPVSDQEFIAHRIPAKTQGSHTHNGPIGIDFRVNYPIVITHLGVFDSDSDGFSHSLNTKLFDVTSKMEVVSASFTPEDPGQLIGAMRFKPVENFILPKGFEGSIVAENFDGSDPCNNEAIVHGHLDNGAGLVTFKRIGNKLEEFPEFEEVIHEEEHQYTAGTFIYHAHTVDYENVTLEEQVSEKDWYQTLADEQTQLAKEQELFRDILFVSEVDVYRNVANKMLQFYKWVSDNISFKYLIKTDDDCYMNVQAILKGIQKHKLEGKTRFWWSRFRAAWLVERHGKWREPDYTADIYPTFACGAGSLLTADLVHWLGKNAADLKPYQGEDVSLGIWLASVGPKLLKDNNWTCFQDCHQHMYSSPQHSPDSLRQMWDNLQKYENPCKSPS